MVERILVVDDEDASRQGLRALLTREGYRVEEAADGAEALEKARAFRPAVVIADLVMPRMDGLGLLKAMQDELPFTGVILLTGQGTVETAVQAMKDGASDYLSKPVDMTRLSVALGKALERAVTLCRAETIEPAHLPGAGRRPPEEARPASAVTVPVGTTVDEAEKALILQTLECTGQNKTRAAEILGISLKTLHNKLHRYRA